MPQEQEVTGSNPVGRAATSREPRALVQVHREVMGGDPQPAVEVEAVRAAAVGAGSRVEVHAPASRGPALVEDPAHQCRRVALPAPAGTRHDIFDVQVAAPGQVFGDLEADDGLRVLVTLLEGADHAIPGGALRIDALDQPLERAGVDAQFEQCGRDALLLALGDLADVAHGPRIIWTASTSAPAPGARRGVYRRSNSWA